MAQLFGLANFSTDQIREFAQIAMLSYGDRDSDGDNTKLSQIPTGWTNRIGSLALPEATFSNQTGIRNQIFQNDTGQAILLQKGDTLVIGFRGTDSLSDQIQEWTTGCSTYYGKFTSSSSGSNPGQNVNFIDAVDNFVLNFGGSIGITKVVAVGHSLGGAAVEDFLASHRNSSAVYGVTFNAPRAMDTSEGRILQVGFENDKVYEIIGDDIQFDSGDNSTNNYYVINDAYISNQTSLSAVHDTAANGRSLFTNSIQLTASSFLYKNISRDDLVVVDQASRGLNIRDVYGVSLRQTGPAFIIGDDRSELMSFTATTSFDGQGSLPLSMSVAVDAGIGNDTVEGTAQNDTIFGNWGHDRILGFSGNDLIYGNQGQDVLSGGLGNDTLVGGQNDYDVRGEPIFRNGETKLRDGLDVLYGNEGNDVLYGNHGGDLGPVDKIVDV